MKTLTDVKTWISTWLKSEPHGRCFNERDQTKIQ